MPDTPLERAQNHYRNGELEQALSAYLEALEQDPQSAETLHAIGVIEAQLGHSDDALAYIDRALAINPDEARILNSKANILARLERLDEAVATYNQAIRIDKDYAIALSGLGKCLYQQQKFATAEKALQRALTLNPSFIEAQFNLALVYSQQGQLDQAIALLEPIVTEHPNFSLALGQLGELYLETQDYNKALKVLDRRAELEPEHSEAMHSLAQALALTNHLEEAVQYYEKALMLNPHHPEANHNLANAYVKLGDPDKALNYYFRQLALAPLAESYFNIGVLMMYQERNKEAIQYFDQAIIQDPLNIHCYLNLGSIFLKLQQHDKAIESYEAALDIEPNNEEIRYIINALSNNEVPQRAPDTYLKNLFNQYADHYDEHLTKYLDYTVPQQLAQLLFDELGSEREQWTVIDLGCGTGLSGAAFKPFASTLIGIDISEEMVAIADKKSLYDQLIVGDIESELAQFNDVDLIVAADVFSYIGDLDALFTAITQSLKPGGLLAFSVERGTEQPFILQKNMRYAHTRDYIESLVAKHQLSLCCCNNTVLRKQQKQPVEGLLTLCRKA